MHAIRQYEFGPASTLLWEEVPDPRPGPGQVRVKVGAAGVHLIDTKIRSGVRMGPLPLPDLPMTPGREVAGVVDEVGEDVPGSLLGTRVVTHLGNASGGYAEYAVAEAAGLHVLPGGLEFPAAVAMMGTGRMTMWLLEVARITAADTVLVLSAAGGIGGLLLQAARNAGATVIGAAGGPAKTAGLAADLAVDYTDPAWPEKVRGQDVTLVFDGVGGVTGRAAFDLLAPGGRVVLYGMAEGSPTAFTSADLFARSLTATVALGPGIFQVEGGIRALEARSLALAAAGELVPGVTAYPLAEAARAQADLESRRAAGKVVLLG